MFCNQCGTFLPDNSQFCIKCGAKMPTQTAYEYSAPAPAPVPAPNPIFTPIPTPIAAPRQRTFLPPLTLITLILVGACLFFVVPFYRIIEQFMIHSSDVFIAVSYVVLGSFLINIFCRKFSVIMIYRAFARHYRYCSLHSIFSPRSL